MPLSAQRLGLGDVPEHRQEVGLHSVEFATGFSLDRAVLRTCCMRHSVETCRIIAYSRRP